MAGNLFGGLGGLMKGLSGLMPQDDPQVKLMNAQSELDDLKMQEQELFAEIGRQAYSANPGAYPQSDKLRLVQMNIMDAEKRLDACNLEKQAAEAAKKSQEEAAACPSCGHVNPEGVKFCQECGGKLTSAGKAFCTSCGAELAAGTRFCGECGGKQGA